jgi:hypothetical protein
MRTRFHRSALLRFFSSGAVWSSERPKLLHLFSRVDSGLDTMKLVNPGLRTQIEDSPETSSCSLTIDLGSSKSHDHPEEEQYNGEFKFWGALDAKSEHAVVTVFSPVSGRSFKYEYDSDNDWWKCREDGHLLQEFFVREIIKVCQGFPNL